MKLDLLLSLMPFFAAGSFGAALVAVREWAKSRVYRKKVDDIVELTVDGQTFRLSREQIQEMALPEDFKGSEQKSRPDSPLDD